MIASALNGQSQTLSRTVSSWEVTPMCTGSWDPRTTRTSGRGRSALTLARPVHILGLHLVTCGDQDFLAIPEDGGVCGRTCGKKDRQPG